MILNISGFSAPFKFNRIELKPCQVYQIRLIDLHGIFTEKAEAGIYQLSSNLIDREKPFDQNTELNYKVWKQLRNKEV